MSWSACRCACHAAGGATHDAAVSAPQRPLSQTPYPGVIELHVDLREAPRRVLRVRERIPASPGALALHYPQWIPGEHAPSGPIDGVTGLIVRAGGRRLAWQRQPLDLYTLRVEVPEGADAIELEFQFLPPSGGGSFGRAVSATPRLAVLAWNQVLFYPAGYRATDITVRADARLPEGWRHGCALAGDVGADGVAFEPVDLQVLVDSPLLTGAHYRCLPLDEDASAPVHLHIVADAERHLQWKAAQIEGHRALVRQARALFGTRHYRRYAFLLTLSDHTAHFGLEHQSSSDNRLDAEFFTDDGLWQTGAGLLPHEFVHSWNGKHRCPVGSATPHYNTPMTGELMWVYEGLTTYWGDVLTARAGLWTPEQYREAVAVDAALMANRSGAAWRSLQDTCDDAAHLYDAPAEWTQWRRTVDFYPEGALLWLAVDTRLRTLSEDTRSLDDFARAFYGGSDGDDSRRPYTLDDLLAALETLQPGAWRAWLRRWLDATGDRDPLWGLHEAGWTLDYTDTPSAYFKQIESQRKIVNLLYSIGLIAGAEDGAVRDVAWPGAAFEAGLAPGMKIVAVDGEKYSAAVLKAAVKRGGGTPCEVDLLVQNLDRYTHHRLHIEQGLRYPRLVRDASRVDRLSAIITAIT